ncbi:MAG TPA: tetratricopeptide repeat protein, partial [Ktedonobacteraceae bacterium]
ATCREEDESRVRGGLGWLFEEVLEIRLPHFNVDANDQTSAEIISDFTEQGATHEEDWDGTIGSLVLGLSRKREQYDQLKAGNELAAVVLRSMKLLTEAGISNLTGRRLRTTCIDIFGQQISLSEEWRWRLAIDMLISLQFVSETMSQDNNDIVLTIRKDSYFEQIITDYPAPGRVNQLISDMQALSGIFSQSRDTAGLAAIGIALMTQSETVDNPPKELVAQVLAIFNQILAVDPNDAFSLTIKASLVAELGDNEGALSDIERALNLDPSIKTWAEFGFSGAELKQLARAFIWDMRGDVLTKLKRFDEALLSYDQAISLDPEYAAYWDSKGDVLRDLKRYAEALAAYDRAITLDSENATYWNDKGLALRDLQRHGEALAAFDQALTLDSNSKFAYDNKGDALRDLQRYGEAIDAYDRAIALDPENAAYWNDKALALRDLKRHDEAIDAYDRATTLAPDDAFYWNGKGNVLYDMGRYNDALVAYEEAIRHDDREPIYLRNKGSALLALMNYAEALSVYDQAIALDPNSKSAYDNKGNTLRALKRLDEAIVSYDRAIALDPENAAYWNDKGLALR